MKLESCPFCGQAVNINPSMEEGKIEVGYFVSHGHPEADFDMRNEPCRMAFGVETLNPWSVWGCFSTPEEAARAWNQRAP